MLFFLSRELWQTVRYCPRIPEPQTNIWHWTAAHAEDDILLHSRQGKRMLSTVVDGVAETARAPVPIVVASSEWSVMFEKVILALASHPGNLRISVLLASCLGESELDHCRKFLQRHRHLQTRISTFFLSTHRDSEMARLDPEAVADEYRTFVRLLCIGREPLADSLGLFRIPLSEESHRLGGLSALDDLEDLDELPLEHNSSYRTTGILASLGVASWLPRRPEIVRLTEGLLSMYVVAEEKRAATTTQLRLAEPEGLIGGALYLGMTDEPLAVRHFAGMIPPPPDPPFETWRVPFFTKRARKQTHYLQRTVQQDFCDYTSLLEETLADISGRIRRQSAVCFSEAARVYRSDLLKDADLGTISLLLREYYPRFGEYDEAALADTGEEPTGWPPDESMDLFCGVYEALDDGLDKLPGSKTWTCATYLSLALFLAAGVLWEPGGLLSMALAAGGVLSLGGVWLYRFFSVRRMRRRLIEISEEVFANLREIFEAEIDRILRQTRVELEREIRTDAVSLGERFRAEFDAIPFLFSAPEVDREECRSQIKQLQQALINIGIDEVKLEPLPTRLEYLARKIVERVTRDVDSDPVPTPEVTPCEIVEEWVDELVGSSIFPLEKVEEMRDEILKVASTWRSPALTAPLTDAELHRGFRKVVVLPNTDIAYQRLSDAVPSFSGNPVVSLKTWTGDAPGIAACSVVTGLPLTILDYHAHNNGNGNGNGHRPVPSEPVEPENDRSIRVEVRQGSGGS